MDKNNTSSNSHKMEILTVAIDIAFRHGLDSALIASFVMIIFATAMSLARGKENRMQVTKSIKTKQ
jgi:hypothetical protein